MPSNVMLRKYLAVVAAGAAIAASPSHALGQADGVIQSGSARNGVRLGAPAGTYIASRLKSADLDGDRSVTQQHDAKKITFTPARATADLAEAAQGYVLGLLETDAEGGETGLNPGRYTIFAKSVGGEWEAFAEVDGAVVKQALRVTADAATESDEDLKPQFSVSDGGWCWTTGSYPAATTWERYDHRGYWHYYPTAWGGRVKLTVCW